MGNNILKENENTFFSNSQEQERTDDDESEEEVDGHLAFAKATIKFLGHRPEFAKKVKELKEMYNL